MRNRLALATLLTFAPISQAAIIDVFPGSPDALQIAIDAANPGDILRINGGTYDPVLIDKPLELIGNPSATIEGLFIPTMPGTPVQRPITISGPGTGQVTLQSITTSGTYDVTQFGTSGATPNVVVDGFDRVRFINCDLTRPQWFANGQIDGAPGISSTVPELVLANTTVRPLNPDTSLLPFEAPPAAIEAAQSTVIAIRCDIEGGTYPFGITDTGSCVPPFSDLGIGGPGVVCNRLFQTGGSVTGGPGAIVNCFGGGTVGQLPDGFPVLAVQHVMQLDNLVEMSPPITGGNWVVDTRTGSTGGLMRIAFAQGPLELNPIVGWNVIESSQVFLLQPVAPYRQQLSFPVAPSTNLFGFDVVAELYDNRYGVIGGAIITQQQ